MLGEQPRSQQGREWSGENTLSVFVETHVGDLTQNLQAGVGHKGQSQLMLLCEVLASEAGKFGVTDSHPPGSPKTAVGP